MAVMVEMEATSTLLEIKASILWLTSEVKNYKAQDGSQGAGSQRHGKNGEDELIHVPIGTIITDIETGVVLADLVENEQKVLVAKGRRGGLGNVNFKTSTNQAPRKFTYGKPNQVFEINLELKATSRYSPCGTT